MTEIEAGEVVGYARVSTDDQDLTMQVKALQASGIPRDMIFAEKVSGAARRLPERDRAVKMVARKGWTLRVWKLDRLGRSVHDVLGIARTLKDSGAYLQTMDGVDTRNELLGPLLLGMLALVAEFERNMIAARTKAGMAARKAAGAVFGAKRKIDARMLASIKREMRERDPENKARLRYTVAQIAEHHGISVNTMHLHSELRAYRSKMGKTLRGRPKRQKTSN